MCVYMMYVAFGRRAVPASTIGRPGSEYIYIEVRWPYCVCSMSAPHAYCCVYERIDSLAHAYIYYGIFSISYADDHSLGWADSVL